MGELKKVSMRTLREILILEVMPGEAYDIYMPDQVLEHAMLLLESVCKHDKRLDSLRWNICNGSGIKAHDKEAFKNGEYYTCTISGRAMGCSTIWGTGKTIQHAIMDAVGQLRGYEVEK